MAVLAIGPPREDTGGYGGRPPGRLLLGLPEDLGDLLDLGEQLVGRLDVDRALGAACACELGGLVEQRVQLRVLLEVRRLEVVRPQHPQVVLDELGALLLDKDGASPERRVLVRGVLLRDRLDGLRLDKRLGRVVDAAGQVAVGVGDGLRREQPGEQPHRFPFSVPKQLRYLPEHYSAAWELNVPARPKTWP